MSLAVNVAPQRNIEGWVELNRPGTDAAVTARPAPRRARGGREHPVTGIKTKGEKRLVLISGRSHPELAAAVAAELDTTLLPVDARTFASGEIYTRMEESVRGCRRVRDPVVLRRRSTSG